MISFSASVNLCKDYYVLACYYSITEHTYTLGSLTYHPCFYLCVNNLRLHLRPCFRLLFRVSYSLLYYFYLHFPSGSKSMTHYISCVCGIAHIPVGFLDITILILLNNLFSFCESCHVVI
ncbi:hypothetical protein EDB89DRAFT_2020029 [Lactarius sanguifluus]|nr:hypothetical protein EDB89DRAFT_2020029 [Lactarius sanguifluus]